MKKIGITEKLLTLHPKNNLFKDVLRKEHTRNANRKMPNISASVPSVIVFIQFSTYKITSKWHENTTFDHDNNV